MRQQAFTKSPRQESRRLTNRPNAPFAAASTSQSDGSARPGFAPAALLHGAGTSRRGRRRRRYSFPASNAGSGPRPYPCSKYARVPRPGGFDYLPRTKRGPQAKALIHSDDTNDLTRLVLRSSMPDVEVAVPRKLLCLIPMKKRFSSPLRLAPRHRLIRPPGHGR